jgi:hypothetical protein
MPQLSIRNVFTHRTGFVASFIQTLIAPDRKQGLGFSIVPPRTGVHGIGIGSTVRSWALRGDLVVVTLL